VTKVHREAEVHRRRGRHVLLVGHAGHPEVVGTMGQLPPGTITLVETIEHIKRLQLADESNLAYVTQTTLSVDDTREMVEALKARFPAIVGPHKDDICYATTNRQLALRAVTTEADLCLVVGSTNSSNSQRLAELAERSGTPTYLIDDVSDIDLRWLAGARTVAITAGASAPTSLIDEIVASLSGLGPVHVEHRNITEETTTFTLPKEIRPR
jgi:4-hydroxy-3-methylbut-2-en-1-yl diphosphate reductase